MWEQARGKECRLVQQCHEGAAFGAWHGEFIKCVERVPLRGGLGSYGVGMDTIDSEGDVVAGDGVGGFECEREVQGVLMIAAWEVPHPFASFPCFLLF